MQAAVEAARALPFPFTLTARAENFLYGRKDLDDTIKRLQAFEAAGADVLYSPGLYDIDTIQTVVSSVEKPFNLVMGFADPTLTVDQLSAAGVKRISVGGAMARVALAAFLRCAREMKDQRRVHLCARDGADRGDAGGVCGRAEDNSPHPRATALPLSLEERRLAPQSRRMAASGLHGSNARRRAPHHEVGTSTTPP